MSYNWTELNIDGETLLVANAYGKNPPDQTRTLSLVRRALEVAPDLQQLAPDYATNGSRVLLDGSHDMEMVTPKNAVVRMDLNKSPARDYPPVDRVEVYTRRVLTDPLWSHLTITVHDESRSDLMERATRETYTGTNEPFKTRLLGY